MKFIGLGSNLKSEQFGSSRQVCEAALDQLSALGLSPLGRSNWYKSAPVPASEQPWFVNGVIALETDLGPRQTLTLCQTVENNMGRVRTVANAPRIIDLDILAWDEDILSEAGLKIPHPRLQERAFVLYPLAELAPEWRHPATGRSVSALIDALDGGQEIEIIT